MSEQFRKRNGKKLCLGNNNTCEKYARPNYCVSHWWW